MTRVIAAAGLFVAVACSALAWPLPFGQATGNRLARGAGTFPRWQALALATESPIRWLVTLPGRRLAAVDRDGALVIFEIVASGLRVAARYGGVASPGGPPVVVRLDHAQTGVVLVAPDGRLLVWSDDGALRGYDVGGPLSSATAPTPITFEDRVSHDLLAVARDGAVVLIGGLAAGGPRAVARLDARALRDARITVADLDGDGAIEAVVLSDVTDPYPPATALVDTPGATSISVIRVRPLGLELRSRFTAPAPAEFEDIVPVLAPVAGSARPVVLAAMIAPGQGAVPVALGLRDAGLVLVAEGPSPGPTGRWLQVVGAADLTGDGVPEVVAVSALSRDGVLTLYRRRAGTLGAVASAAGYAAGARGSRHPDHAVMGDFDGDGRLEVVLPRQSGEILVALEMRNERFVERWAVDFKSPVTSNLAAADIDGDGLLDLAVATRRALHVFLSLR
jgi:hypothetical protein